MILSDGTISRMLKEGALQIEPLEKEQIQPASVDIRLGRTFSIVEDSSDGIITLEHEIHYKTIQSHRYLLLPNQFVLATTMELFVCMTILPLLWKAEVHWEEWAFLFKTPDGWTPDFKGKLPWNCTTPTAALLN